MVVIEKTHYAFKSSYFNLPDSTNLLYNLELASAELTLSLPTPGPPGDDSGGACGVFGLPFRRGFLWRWGAFPSGSLCVRCQRTRERTRERRAPFLVLRGGTEQEGIAS